MKYGVYVAYWLNDWVGDYKKYIVKAAELGFDILEISCASFADKYTTDAQLIELRELAKEKGIILTAGYGPGKQHNPHSLDENVRKGSFEFFKNILEKLKLMNIKNVGGGVYSYWPVDYTQPIDKEGDWKLSVKSVKEIAKVAADCDVTLGLEVLNRFEGYLLNTCAEAL